jgi:hypothetical protein
MKRNLYFKNKYKIIKKIYYLSMELMIIVILSFVVGYCEVIDSESVDDIINVDRYSPRKKWVNPYIKDANNIWMLGKNNFDSLEDLLVASDYQQVLIVAVSDCSQNGSRSTFGAFLLLDKVER